MRFKIKFTKSQWSRLSEIAGNLGLLSIASLVIPYLLDKLNFTNVILGIALAVGMWYASLVSARRY